MIPGSLGPKSRKEAVCLVTVATFVPCWITLFMKSEGQVKEGYQITYSEFCNSDHQTKAQGMRDNKWVSDLCFNLVTQNVCQ